VINFCQVIHETSIGTLNASYKDRFLTHITNYDLCIQAEGKPQVNVNVKPCTMTSFTFADFNRGAVHKIRLQSGGVNVVQITEKRRIFRYGLPHILAQKNLRFFEIYGVPHGQRERGLSQFGYFADKGGQLFSILYGRLLWTAPNNQALCDVMHKILVFSTH